METGKYFVQNHKRLELVSESDWAIALQNCRDHILIRIKRRTTYGAHTAARLGEDPNDYYLAYAYEAILSGRWEWKSGRTLSQQMIVIADSTISTEVEKMSTKSAGKPPVSYEDPAIFYDTDTMPEKLEYTQEVIIDKQISIIEEAIKGDSDLEFFWECIKEGMKTAEISDLMGKTAKQLEKLRARFINKIKKSPYFELE